MADEKEKKTSVNKEVKKTETTKNTANKNTQKNKNTSSSKTVNVKKDKNTSTTKVAPKNKETEKVEAKKVETKATTKKETVKEDELIAKATVKYARISSRKVKIVADLIRGKNVDEALAILQFTPKAGSELLTKLLNSAIANAENNNQMTHSKLYIADIYSNQGPTLKRIRPAAKGSAVRIRKRTSHTTIVLKERD